MKGLRGLLLGLTTILALAQASWAAGALKDSLTVTITPGALYALDITTTGVNLDMGTVNLGASTQTVKPSTVSIESTYAATDLRLLGQISGSGTPWTFDDDTASNESDKLAAWAVFTDTGMALTPAQGANYFTGTQPGVSNSCVFDASDRDVGDNGAVLNLFQATGGAPGYKDMEDLPSALVLPGAGKAHLWLYFRLPNATTDTNPKFVTVTLTAVAPN